MKKTVEIIKDKNQLQEKVVDFIKNADLYMNNFEYVDMNKIGLKADDDGRSEKKVLELSETIMDQIRLVSAYKGVHVPSAKSGNRSNV